MWFSGGWFTVSALLLVSPLGTMILFFLVLDLLGGRPDGAYLGMMASSVGLPLVLAFGMGALVGPRILRLPSGKSVHAAAWGAMAAFGALLLWTLLLEGLPRLLMRPIRAAGGGSDVPGAAEVVGYLVVLPLIVLLTLLVGATSGVLLHVFASRGATN